MPLELASTAMASRPSTAGSGRSGPAACPAPGVAAITCFTDAGRYGRCAIDVRTKVPGQDEHQLTRCVRAAPLPQRVRGTTVPTPSMYEMAGVLEALEEVKESQALLHDLCPPRLARRVVVYNDNVQVVEFAQAGYHTPESMTDAGADHLVPLASAVWALTLELRAAGCEVLFLRPPRGRKSRRLPDVDNRSHGRRAPTDLAVHDGTAQACSEGVVVAYQMIREGRDGLLAHL